MVEPRDPTPQSWPHPNHGREPAAPARPLPRAAPCSRALAWHRLRCRVAVADGGDPSAYPLSRACLTVHRKEAHLLRVECPIFSRSPCQATLRPPPKTLWPQVPRQRHVRRGVLLHAHRQRPKGRAARRRRPVAARREDHRRRAHAAGAGAAVSGGAMDSAPSRYDLWPLPFARWTATYIYSSCRSFGGAEQAACGCLLHGRLRCHGSRFMYIAAALQRRRAAARPHVP